MRVNPIQNHAIRFIRGLPEEAMRLTFLRDLSASAVQSPSPCTEIALARLATQTPEYPKNPISIRVKKNGLGA